MLEVTIAYPKRKHRLIRWKWLGDDLPGQQRRRYLEIYMPGPDGGPKGGKLLLITSPAPRKRTVREYRELIERHFRREILRRYAGVSGGVSPKHC